MLAAAPINTNLIDETHDVRYLFSRKGARRFGRPDQMTAGMRAGQVCGWNRMSTAV